MFAQSLIRRASRLGFGALVAGSLACTGDSTGPESIEGTYTLQTMAGRSLPAILLQDESGKFEITSGSIVLRAPNAFTMSLTFRQTVGTQMTSETIEADGTWTRSGATVTLTSDGEAVLATLSGRTLTLIGDAEDLGTIEWVFRR